MWTLQLGEVGPEWRVGPESAGPHSPGIRAPLPIWLIRGRGSLATAGGSCAGLCVVTRLRPSGAMDAAVAETWVAPTRSLRRRLLIRLAQLPHLGHRLLADLLLVRLQGRQLRRRLTGYRRRVRIMWAERAASRFACALPASREWTPAPTRSRSAQAQPRRGTLTEVTPTQRRVRQIRAPRPNASAPAPFHSTHCGRTFKSPRRTDLLGRRRKTVSGALHRAAVRLVQPRQHRLVTHPLERVPPPIRTPLPYRPPPPPTFRSVPRQGARGGHGGAVRRTPAAPLRPAPPQYLPVRSWCCCSGQPGPGPQLPPYGIWAAARRFRRVRRTNQRPRRAPTSPRAPRSHGSRRVGWLSAAFSAALDAALPGSVSPARPTPRTPGGPATGTRPPGPGRPGSPGRLAGGRSRTRSNRSAWPRRWDHRSCST